MIRFDTLSYSRLLCPVPEQGASVQARVSDYAGSNGCSHYRLREYQSFAAPWLAYTFPCRRFADILAEACAWLGADVGCYSFIAVDFHHLLPTGLPAHPHN